MSYKMVGKFHKCGYKFNTWYDMVWMEKHIGEHKENPKKIKPFTEIREELKNNKKIICQKIGTGLGDMPGWKYVEVYKY